MAWYRPWDKPLYEATLDSLLTHICVTRPHWDEEIIWACGSCALRAFSWKSAVSYDVSNHRQLHGLRNSLFKLEHNKEKLRIPGVLCELSSGDRSDSTHKGANDGENIPWHGVFIVDTQRTHDVKRTSSLCQNYVATSFWRNNVCVVCPLGIISGASFSQ